MGEVPADYDHYDFAYSPEHAEVCRERDRLKAENARLREALDEFERRTRAIPEGHEDRTKGASSYNWRMSCLREIRELAALKETDQ